MGITMKYLMLLWKLLLTSDRFPTITLLGKKNEQQIISQVSQGKIKEPTNESLFEAMREMGIEPNFTYED